ncbi:MAG: XrtA/PEP-CTERM system-associated ATPase [Candidatus Methylumidiphilus sp.]
MYSSFYNLTKKPFQMNPDPQFFFNSAVHKRGLAYLRYGLEQGEGFIVVTGAPGTGKTMLVKELFETIRKDEVVPGLMVTSQVGAEDALRMVAGSFDLPYDSFAKAVLLKNLEVFFKLKSQEGKRVLLVVDEAQHLPYQSLEELRMLLNMELDGKPILQIFMLGQDELRCLLQADNMEQVRQRITATYHLRALEKEETRDYILHRLLTAGWNNNPSFTDQVFDDIFGFTGGTPRIINNLCDRLLLYGFLEELHVIDSDAANVVIQEIEQDLKFQKSGPSVTKIDCTPILQNSLSQETLQASYSEIGGRLDRLEYQINEIRSDFQKQRALLRKAILIQLDNDHAFDI